MVSESAARLWREAVERPDDDGVRAVLADMLQAAGDARGELMALQLLPPDDAGAHQQRIQELLVQHAARWLGPLRAVARAATFERGFLTRLAIEHPRFELDDPRMAECLGDPLLATVEDVMGAGEVYARFVTAAAMTSLRRIEVFNVQAVAALEATPAPIAHAAVMLDAITELATLHRLLPVIAARTAITSLAVDLATFEQVARAPWFDRLTALTVGTTTRRGIELWSRIPRGTALTIAPIPRLRPCEREFPWDYQLDLVPGADGVTARISGRWLLQPLDALAGLPDLVTRVEIEEAGPAPLAPRVRELVARPGREVVSRPQRRHGYLAW